MTAVVLCFFLIFIQSLSRSEDESIPTFFSIGDEREKTVLGRLDEDIILPCSFESGSEIVIHWTNHDNYIYSYYRGSDHLEKQDPRYTNRTSLFHNEIHNGNASLSVKRLSLQDEGIYICYVGTSSNKFKGKVVLKVGAFTTPVMTYENRITSSALICSVLSVYPHAKFTWQMDNTPISDNSIEEINSSGSLYIYSTINTTVSNSSYECAIKNSLLEQTWTGQWAMKDDLHKMHSEDVSLSCEFPNDFFLPNQDFTVTWSRMEHGTFSTLANFQSSSRNIVINEYRLSCNKELINQGVISSTLKALRVSDSGEYLCTISTSNYTLLTVQKVHVEPRQTSYEVIVVAIVGTLVVLTMFLVIACIILKLIQRIPSTSGSRNPSSTNGTHPDPFHMRSLIMGSDSREDKEGIAIFFPVVP
ncbi:HERV-H LTR-associating protein 2 [Erinaceus europaeus]|uniref:HERV-H LTR-associating protein 2 n=1 Tax=Erinaceus europaeus TaxID=9365 RepID=A0ABM3Y004_ERIEU|nr:HERV-H LTR-associating protein 2 [Erinaceus europaeus]